MPAAFLQIPGFLVTNSGQSFNLEPIGDYLKNVKTEFHRILGSLGNRFCEKMSLLLKPEVSLVRHHDQKENK